MCRPREMPIYVSEPPASPEKISDLLQPALSPPSMHEKELHQRRDYYKLVMADTCQVCDDLSFASLRNRFRSADDGCVGRRSQVEVDSACRDRLSVSMSGAHMRYLLPRDVSVVENDSVVPKDTGTESSLEVDWHTEQESPAFTEEDAIENEKDEVDSRERSASHYSLASNVRVRGDRADSFARIFGTQSNTSLANITIGWDDSDVRTRSRRTDALDTNELDRLSVSMNGSHRNYLRDLDDPVDDAGDRLSVSMSGAHRTVLPRRTSTREGSDKSESDCIPQNRSREGSEENKRVGGFDSSVSSLASGSTRSSGRTSIRRKSLPRHRCSLTNSMVRGIIRTPKYSRRHSTGDFSDLDITQPRNNHSELGSSSSHSTPISSCRREYSSPVLRLKRGLSESFTQLKPDDILREINNPTSPDEEESPTEDESCSFGSSKHSEPHSVLFSTDVEVYVFSRERKI
ncbi:hypothetical protein THAOC_14135 [Thalassiosira oceanica]|uniref:Uncharacterized protein n=1 Tax=Thalassiosira oceanica TaxID=159749 RepID=K0SFZ3_THAOC|nr:hypothetical protein THAOC_14135 [Thalassiosira oceanica]|eukprot:EJK65063.1 hypothetical protein THAOC_14135 [Thalassiosira oceanica]